MTTSIEVNTIIIVSVERIATADNSTFYSFEEANNYIAKLKEEHRIIGKVDFVILWEDGTRYEGMMKDETQINEYIKLRLESFNENNPNAVDVIGNNNEFIKRYLSLNNKKELVEINSMNDLQTQEIKLKSLFFSIVNQNLTKNELFEATLKLMQDLEKQVMEDTKKRTTSLLVKKFENLLGEIKKNN